MTPVPDCFSLSYSRILTVRSWASRPLFCFLYYNLCLCKSLKEHAPERSASKVGLPCKRRPPLVCGCKGKAFSRTDKTFRTFFSQKNKRGDIYIIYYICAGRKKKASPGPSKGGGKEGKGEAESLAHCEEPEGGRAFFTWSVRVVALRLFPVGSIDVSATLSTSVFRHDVFME